MATTIPEYIVGIGGSAGGLKAYITLLDGLPAHTGMAFVIISHMSPTGESLLPHILSQKTSMPVVQATDGMLIQKNYVYVIPPNTNLLVNNYAFKLTTPRTLSHGRHNQVDAFLSSLAKMMGARAIGVVMSGGDGDGTEGCKQIKAMGGTTFAQDLSAEVDSMPLSAQAAGSIDFVLSPEEIAAELAQMGQSFVHEKPSAANQPSKPT